MKQTFIALGAVLICATSVQAQEIFYGLDSSEWANDGVCDDRRFYGEPTLIGSRDKIHILADATDCRKAHEAGRIVFWQEEAAFAEAISTLSCKEAAFGNNLGDFPDDGECDDPRFEGIGSAAALFEDDSYRDASDCQSLCERGLLFYLGEPEY